MSSNISWIKMPVNFYSLPEIEQINGLPWGKNVVALYPQLLCLAGELNKRGCFVMNSVSFTPKMFAKHLKINLNLMEKALNLFLKFDLLGIENGTYFIPQWEIWQSADRLDSIREKDRIRKRNARENARLARAEFLWSVHGQKTESPCVE